MSIGIIGLGSMGAAMAHRLLATGHQVTGYNRTRASSEALAGDGLRIAAEPADAFDTGVLIFIVTGEAATEALLLPGGRLETAGYPVGARAVPF
jgi:3-hydroxyisobutyrate dehydrogenase